ncbi:hypothetical protein HNQ51_000649 [Inhella inkyongensis]|uniref:Uncharacterized protein n=1 Tax=Inhella inkyongensis TaxID=392593 RepID=A0A840S2P7_9BURK|nr:hypothetical protein [Inhella inkyongensis]MBB5203356.1 hypothetical protein [Inhella inkyongensis]
MQSFHDTHPAPLQTIPAALEADRPTQAQTGMRLMGVLLGLLFACLHGMVLLNQGLIEGTLVLERAQLEWLRPWHWLWFSLALLGWLGLLGIVRQSFRGEPETQNPGLRWLVLAGLLSCVAALMPWWMAPDAATRSALGPWTSALWLCLPLPFWLGWRLRVAELERSAR